MSTITRQCPLATKRGGRGDRHAASVREVCLVGSSRPIGLGRPRGCFEGRAYRIEAHDGGDGRYYAHLLAVGGTPS